MATNPAFVDDEATDSSSVVGDDEVFDADAPGQGVDQGSLKVHVMSYRSILIELKDSEDKFRYRPKP